MVYNIFVKSINFSLYEGVKVQMFFGDFFPPDTINQIVSKKVLIDALIIQVWFKNRRAKCRQQAKQQPPPPTTSEKLSLASRMKSPKKIGSIGSSSNGHSVASTSLAVSSALKSSPRSTPSRDSPFDSGKNSIFPCFPTLSIPNRLKYE